MRTIDLIEGRIREAEQAKATAREKIRVLSLVIEESEETKKDRLTQIGELDEEIKEFRESIEWLRSKHE